MRMRDEEKIHGAKGRWQYYKHSSFLILYHMENGRDDDSKACHMFLQEQRCNMTETSNTIYEYMESIVHRPST